MGKDCVVDFLLHHGPWFCSVRQLRSNEVVCSEIDKDCSRQ